MSDGKQSSSKGGAGGQLPDPLSQALQRLHASPTAHKLTPSAIVQQLDKYIVGQPDAKRAVAVALRNRWRRHMLPDDLAAEITPKNILMIGPTGCGKTEIARRLAQLVSSPFIKVEATKFTELGFVGRDVDEIVKDLMEASLNLTRTRLADALREVADQAAEDIILKSLTGSETEHGLSRFRQLYRDGVLDNTNVTLDLDDLAQKGQGGTQQHSSPMQAMAAMLEVMMTRQGPRGMAGRQGGKVTMMVAEARKLLSDGEIERSLNSDRVVAEALRAAQEDGIVFIDEVDKIVETSRGVGGATSSNVSSEGVQRDLLPILEGSVVPTKYGNVSTDHVLFIASGAFHSSKPSDMLAELQGRLPVRVELAGLTAEDFYRILTEPQHNMIKQQQVLLVTEGVDLVFTDGAIRAIAEAAHQANQLLDNIGARRLHTVVERVLADISYSAPERVAAQQAQQQQVEDGAPASSSTTADVSRSPSTSGKGAKGGGKAGAAARSGSSRSSKASRQDTSSSKEASSSSSKDSSKTVQLLQYVVTEDMVHSCMAEVLKQKDLSRYML